MGIARFSFARVYYECDGCRGQIPRRAMYCRVEPHPKARVHRGEPVLRYCERCVPPPPPGDPPEPYGFDFRQLRLTWSDSDDPETIIRETNVEVVDITPQLLASLGRDPAELVHISPDLFEELVCDCLSRMGHHVQRIGRGLYGKDGGVDILAVPAHSAFPFLLGVQVKHHRSDTYKVGPAPVRELRGAINSVPCNAGLLVTNTTFTPDAKWVAAQEPMLLRLRDLEDVGRWLRNEFLDEYDWRDLPQSVEFCPGVVVNIPRARRES